MLPWAFLLGTVRPLRTGSRGAGTRGLSPPLPHRPSASPASPPPLPSRAPPSLPAQCPPALSLCPFPSCDPSPGWGGGLGGGAGGGRAGQHGRLLCATPAVPKPGGPWVPCSLGPGRQGSLVCLVSGVLLCGKEASTTPEPSQDRGEPETGPLPTPGNPGASSQGMCGVPAGVPRERQVAAVAPLGPGPPPPSCYPLWAPCPSLRGIPQPRLCLATAYSSPLLHLSSPMLTSALGPSGHQHLLPSCPSRPRRSPCDLS